MSLKRSLNGAMKCICFLQPITPNDQIIKLNIGKNILGRSTETGIRDTRCSKQQLELYVHNNSSKITLKVLGINPCGVNGLMVMKNSECELEHGDIVEFVYGRHAFEVTFKPPPEKKAEGECKIEAPNENKVQEEFKTDSWDSIDNGKMLVYTSVGVCSSQKIAGYDMDGTIIKTKSGKVFPTNTDDWQIIYPQVPVKLKKLHESGYKLCFFTNQGGIAKGKVNLNDFKQKIKNILKVLQVPVQVYIAISDGYFRKPLPGMWEHMKDHKNSNLLLNTGKCFYVGDAAGRPEMGSGIGKRKKDHSTADRLFAANIGVSFFTPEEHFLGKSIEQYEQPSFDPKEISADIPLLEPSDAKLSANECEMIIMVGLPGSGKSHFVQKHLAPLKYEIANSDTLGSVPACLKSCSMALSAGVSCVVDNTNVDPEARKKFIDLAKKYKIPCRCFLLNIPVPQMRHNIVFRQLTDSSHSKINDMVFNMLKKRFKTPTLEEGFSQIVHVNFVPRFLSEKEENLYKLYLLEK